MSVIDNQANIDPNSIKTPDDERHLYIWLDILGFSKEVEEKENDEQGKTEIENILNDFRTIFIGTLMGETSQELDEFKKKAVKTKNDQVDKKGGSLIDDGRMISDGIVLDLGALTDIANNLRDVFYEIGIRQIFFMVKHKRLIRGGIALGKTILGRQNKRDRQNQSNQHYVSSGLTQAYSIESKKVSWPIIATTEKHMMKIQNCIQVENSFGLEQTFNQHGEEIYFIDFLQGTQRQDRYIDFLNESLAKEAGGKNHSVCGKILWLIKHYYRKHKKQKTQSNYPLLNKAVLYERK